MKTSLVALLALLSLKVMAASSITAKPYDSSAAAVTFAAGASPCARLHDLETVSKSDGPTRAAFIFPCLSHTSTLSPSHKSAATHNGGASLAGDLNGNHPTDDFEKLGASNNFFTGGS